MIRNLLATTAIATLIASGAMAQTTTPTVDPADPAAGGQQQQEMRIQAEGHLASNLIGETVYNGTGENAENIGEVTDLVIRQDGNVEAIVVGVGGFLGIGQKEVALQYDLAQWSEQQDGERWLIVETTKEALEGQQEFDRAAYRPMPADAEIAETRPATQEDLAVAPQSGDQQQETETAVAPLEGPDAGTAEDTETAEAMPEDQQTQETAAMPEDQQQTTEQTAVLPQEEPTDETAAVTEETQPTTQADQQMAAEPQQQPAEQQTARTEAPTDEAVATDQTETAAIDRSRLQQAQPDQMRAENLTGSGVYGANEERIGEVGDVILTPEGQIDAVIVDVGGFLGIGEKEVAIGMDNLAFMSDQDGNLYLYTEFSQEELEAQPAYDQASYEEQRDQMRMQVQ